METKTVKKKVSVLKGKPSIDTVVRNPWYSVYKTILKRTEYKQRLEELLTVDTPKTPKETDIFGVWNEYQNKIESLKLLINGE